MQHDVTNAILNTSLLTTTRLHFPTINFPAASSLRHHTFSRDMDKKRFNGQQQIWFWINGGSWSFGVNLPARFQTNISDGVTITLGSARPYVEHVYVEEHYGRPWRDKHRKKNPDKRHGHDN